MLYLTFLPLCCNSERRRLRCFSGQNAFSPEKSTFQLIASLCLPVLERSLEVCKLLALSSKNIAKEAYNYAVEGKLTEFAVLLMVALKKVLVPITFSKKMVMVGMEVRWSTNTLKMQLGH